MELVHHALTRTVEYVQTARICKNFGDPGKLKKKCHLRACSAQIQSRNLQQINKEVLSQAHFNVINNDIDEQQGPVSNVALERLEHVGPTLGS